MAAYLIVDLDVFDEAGMAEYRKQVGASIESFGGRVLVRAPAGSTSWRETGIPRAWS